MINDRTIVSDECWSKYPLNKRIYCYGQLITGDQYQVASEDIESYKSLVNALNEKRCVVITGQPGSGKSLLTKIISKVTYPLNHPKRYKFISAQEICNDFAMLGHKALKKYTVGNWIFDDVGREDKTGIGGGFKTYNVMDKVLDDIHSNVLRGLASFVISTNDTKETLSLKYSPQVISRLNQICEFVTISGKDYRANKMIIDCYPEVIHPVKESTQLELTEEEKIEGQKIKNTILNELVKKFNITQVREKRGEAKFLKPTDFEQAIDQWFSEQWLKQGNKTRESNNEAVIDYEGNEYSRGEFLNFCRELQEKRQLEADTPHKCDCCQDEVVCGESCPNLKEVA